MNRRRFLRSTSLLAAAPLFGPQFVIGAEPVPQSVQELWADFDPRQDPLETEVIREWREDGGVFRHVRFLVGTFKGKPARMAAVFGFPDGAKAKLPAVMHIHGGGQRSSLSEVKLLVARGFAALSVTRSTRTACSPTPSLSKSGRSNAVPTTARSTTASTCSKSPPRA